jgi:two-component system OmpR family response regulator
VSCDHDVQSASDGTEALDIAASFNPDVAIVDWMLGAKMDGLSVAESLQDMRPSTRIVITSGHMDVRQQVPSDAPYAYLTKPFRLAELLALFGDTAS